MTTRTWNRWVWAVCVSSLGVLVSGNAMAETCPTIALSLPTPPQRYYSGPDTAPNVYPSRPANEAPTFIDLRDCQDDIHLEFVVASSGLPCSDTIQVWAGPTDCTQLTARQTHSGSPRCWPV